LEQSSEARWQGQLTGYYGYPAYSYSGYAPAYYGYAYSPGYYAPRPDYGCWRGRYGYRYRVC
jgi:hypothetical protein